MTKQHTNNARLTQRTTGVLLSLLGLALFSLSSLAAPSPSLPTPSYSNPLLPSGADPWIVQRDGMYYYMNTEGDRIALRVTRDLARLRQTPSITVWTPPADGPGSISLWAPELHWLRGKWYLYYTAAERGHDDDEHRGIFVLEHDGSDPSLGRWISKGKLALHKPGIDATVFELHGQLYLVYSAYVADHSDLVISRMRNPWTLSGAQVDIAQPNYPWEMQGGRKIMEGPEFIQGPGGKLFLTYSASACWSDDYALGMLSAMPGADPLNPAAWHKAPFPVLATAAKAGAYATGHNGFFKAPNGQDWIVYHANAGPGLKCGRQRAPHMQPVNWRTDGTPDFSSPAPSGVPLPAPH